MPMLIDLGAHGYKDLSVASLARTGDVAVSMRVEAVCVCYKLQRHPLADCAELTAPGRHR